MKYLKSNLTDDPSIWGGMLGWLFVHSLGKVVGETGFEQRSRSWIDEWLLGRIVAGVLHDLGLDEAAAWRAVAVINILTTHQRWFDFGDLPGSTGRARTGSRAEVQAPRRERAYQVLESLLRDGEVQGFLQINRYQGILWFNKEAFDQLLWWLLLLAMVEISADPQRAASEVAEEIVACYDIVRKWQRAEKKSGYQVERLLALVF